MTAGAIVLMLCMAVLMAGMVLTYERLLDQVSRERDEALADADLATDLFIAARERHPSNVRVLRVVE